MTPGSTVGIFPSQPVTCASQQGPTHIRLFSLGIDESPGHQSVGNCWNLRPLQVFVLVSVHMETQQHPHPDWVGFNLPWWKRPPDSILNVLPSLAQTLICSEHSRCLPYSVLLLDWSNNAWTWEWLATAGVDCTIATDGELRHHQNQVEFVLIFHFMVSFDCLPHWFPLFLLNGEEPDHDQALLINSYLPENFWRISFQVSGERMTKWDPFHCQWTPFKMTSSRAKTPLR